MDADVERVAIEAVTRLGIDSHRTEIVALEAAVARVFSVTARLPLTAQS